MKRSLVVLLVLIVAAGWLGTLIAEDPGYVLITYGEHSVQTGLWVFFGVVIDVSDFGLLCDRRHKMAAWDRERYATLACGLEAHQINSVNG